VPPLQFAIRPVAIQTRGAFVSQVGGTFVVVCFRVGCSSVGAFSVGSEGRRGHWAGVEPEWWFGSASSRNGGLLFSPRLFSMMGIV
jgi:hypothetical protein